MNDKEVVLRVGYDLKGDKTHHAVDITMDKFDPYEAWKTVMEEFKVERIVRALVLIDCVKLAKNNVTPLGA